MEPVVMAAPDEFVMRDVRKAAAPRLGCQVPEVGAEVGPWAGSEGNVTAYCRGYQIHYYLRCITNHQCKATITD
jgi:hypothetical protein